MRCCAFGGRVDVLVRGALAEELSWGGCGRMEAIPGEELGFYILD